MTVTRAWAHAHPITKEMIDLVVARSMYRSRDVVSAGLDMKL